MKIVFITYEELNLPRANPGVDYLYNVKISFLKQLVLEKKTEIHNK